MRGWSVGVIYRHYRAIAAASLLSYSIYLSYPFNQPFSFPRPGLGSLSSKPQKPEKSDQEQKQEQLEKQREEFAEVTSRLLTDDMLITLRNLPKFLLLDLAESEKLANKDERSLNIIFRSPRVKDPGLFQIQRPSLSDFMIFLMTLKELNPELSVDDILTKLHEGLLLKIDNIAQSQPDAKSQARVSSEIDVMMQSLRTVEGVGIAMLDRLSKTLDF